MIIPFLHKTAAGITDDASALRWVQVAFFRGRLIHLKYEEEVLQEENKEEAWKLLASRVPGKRVPVAVGINPMYRRLHLLEGPVFEEDEDFDQWLETEIAKLLPVRAEKGAFNVLFEIVSLTESAVRCLVLIARTGIQTPLVQEAEDNEFHVTAVTAPVAGMYLGYGLTGTEWVVLKTENEAVLIKQEDGELRAIEELVGQNSDSLMQEANDHAAAYDTRAQEASSEVRFLDESHDDDLLVDGFRIPYRFISAFWLAAAAARGTTLNTLSPDRVARSADAINRSVFMKSALRVGLALAACLLVATGALLGASQLKVQGEAKLELLSGPLGKVEEAQARVQKLEADLDQSMQLAHLRTHTASLVEQLALRVPDELWLTRIQYDAEAVLVVQGHALDRLSMTQFILSLETAPFTESMSLQYANEVKATKVYRTVRLYQERIIQFEISLGLKEVVHGYK